MGIMNAVTSAIEHAWDEAQAEFKRRGVRATDDDLINATANHPLVQLVLDNKEAYRTMLRFLIAEAVDDLPRQPDETLDAYVERLTAHIRARLEAARDK